MSLLSTRYRALILGALMVLSGTAFPGHAQSRHQGSTSEISIEGLPAGPEDFLVLRDRLSSTPEGAAAVFVMALLKYAEDQAVGEQFLIHADFARAHCGQTLRRTLVRGGNLARAGIQGVRSLQDQATRADRRQVQ